MLMRREKTVSHPSGKLPPIRRAVIISKDMQQGLVAAVPRFLRPLLKSLRAPIVGQSSPHCLSMILTNFCVCLTLCYMLMTQIFLDVSKVPWITLRFRGILLLLKHGLLRIDFLLTSPNMQFYHCRQEDFLLKHSLITCT